jgi:hypothetical protein
MKTAAYLAFALLGVERGGAHRNQLSTKGSLVGSSLNYQLIQVNAQEETTWQI